MDICGVRNLDEAYFRIHCPRPNCDGQFAIGNGDILSIPIVLHGRAATGAADQGKTALAVIAIGLGIALDHFPLSVVSITVRLKNTTEYLPVRLGLR